MGNLVEDFKASEESQRQLGHYSNPADWDDMANKIDAYAREEKMSFSKARKILMNNKLA